MENANTSVTNETWKQILLAVTLEKLGKPFCHVNSPFFVLFALVEVEAQYTMHTILKSDQKIIYYNFAESKGSQKRYDIMI